MRQIYLENLIGNKAYTANLVISEDQEQPKYVTTANLPEGLARPTTFENAEYALNWSPDKRRPNYYSYYKIPELENIISPIAHKLEKLLTHPDVNSLTQKIAKHEMILRKRWKEQASTLSSAEFNSADAQKEFEHLRATLRALYDNLKILIYGPSSE